MFWIGTGVKLSHMQKFNHNTVPVMHKVAAWLLEYIMASLEDCRGVLLKPSILKVYRGLQFVLIQTKITVNITESLTLYAWLSYVLSTTETKCFVIIKSAKLFNSMFQKYPHHLHAFIFSGYRFQISKVVRNCEVFTECFWLTHSNTQKWLPLQLWLNA